MNEELNELKQYLNEKFQTSLSNLNMTRNEFNEIRNRKDKSNEIGQKLNDDILFTKRWIPAVIYNNLLTEVEKIWNDLPF